MVSNWLRLKRKDEAVSKKPVKVQNKDQVVTHKSDEVLKKKKM